MANTMLGWSDTIVSKEPECRSINSQKERVELTGLRALHTCTHHLRDYTYLKHAAEGRSDVVAIASGSRKPKRQPGASR
jgi:hypothetical protein